MPTAVLHVGYLMERTRASEALLCAFSQPLDIARFGSIIRMPQILIASSFCSFAVLEAESHGRSVLLNMHQASSSVQNALLKLLEESTSTVQFVLTASRVSDLLPTIVSRCIVVEHVHTNYGQTLRELVNGGMSMERASQVVGQLDQGYSVELAPTDQDYNFVKTLINAALADDLELGIQVSKSFVPTTLTALREYLNVPRFRSVLMHTYGLIEPEDIAIVVLRRICDLR